MKEKNISFYVPYNIDIKKILKAEGKGKRYINSKIDKFHWFLNSLYIRPLIDKKYTQGDFIPMSRRIMDKVLNSDYVTDIIRILAKHNIIENDGDYVIGEKSIGYRLTPQYQVSHVKVEATFNQNFTYKLQELNEDDISKMDAATYYTYLQLNNLSIRKRAAIAFIESWYQGKIQLECPKLIKKLKKRNRKMPKIARKAAIKGKEIQYMPLTYIEMLEQMKDSYLMQVEAVCEMMWLPVRDNKGNRIHTYLTNLWKPLRQFLYLKYNPEAQLVAIDCSNSQPFTMVKILIERFMDVDLSSGEHEDVLFYIDLVKNGQLYNFMCDMLDITDEEEKAEFKVNMFARVFYPPNDKGYFTEEACMFRQYFPTVYQVVMHEKRVWDCEHKMFRHENLSIEMQKVETRAVVDGVLTQLMNKYGLNVWFSSIHDSILCPADYEAEVKVLMLEHYTAVVGAVPHIKPAEKVNVCNIEEIAEVQFQDEKRQVTETIKPAEEFEPSLKKEPTKRYKYLSSNEMWELQEDEEWGDERAARILKHVETISELDFDEDDLIFYHYKYRIERKYWKEVTIKQLI